ncbi:MAG: tandem-95 repeat protein [Bacteroidales bacterium]|nr:tandem-95 repeat protein [Bacteroidales bacterium]
MIQLKLHQYIVVALALLIVNNAFADPPEAHSVTITTGPFVPVTSIVGSYTFYDPDGDGESGTVLEWFTSASSSGSSPTLYTSGTSTINATVALRGLYVAFRVTPGDDNPGDPAGTPVFSNWELVNGAPVAVLDQYFGLSDEGDDLVLAAPGILGNDLGADEGQTLTVNLPVVSGPTYGSLSINTNGSFTYTHDGSENLTDQFTYNMTDGYETSNSVVVQIQVNQVNDAPIFTSVPVITATEGIVYTYNIITSDPENHVRTVSGITVPTWLTLTPGPSGTATLTGTPGNDDVGPNSVTLRVSDATEHSDQSFTINVTGVNDPPELDNIETTPLAYQEGQAATVITSTITVDDPDNSQLQSGTVSITSGLVTTEDILSLPSTPQYTTSYSPSTGILSITGSTSLSVYQQALRNVSYRNSNTADPDETDRVITFRVYDGTAYSNLETRTIEITGVNDRPDAVEDSYEGVNEGETLTVLAADGVLDNDIDVDNDPSELEAHLVDDVLYGDLTLNLDGSFTYEHDGSNNHSDAFTYYAYDSEDESDTVVVNITITDVNDAPVLDNIETTHLIFTEDDNPRLITATITVTDGDDSSLEEAEVVIDSNFVSGEDSLTFPIIGALTIEFDTLTGILTATGTAPVSTYQNLFRSIRYWNTNHEDPSELGRKVTFTVSDGDSISDPVSRIIEIVGTNDPPEAEDADILGTDFYVDELLTASYTFTDPDGDPEGNTLFRWYTAENEEGDDWRQITGAISDTFTTRFSEGGRYISLVVRPYDIYGLVGVYDTSAPYYIDAAPEFITFAVMNEEHPGAIAVGETVSVDYEYSDFENDDEGIHEFQWYRSETGSWDDAIEIPGEDTEEYEIVEADTGLYIGIEGTPFALDGSSPGDVYRSGWYLVSELPSAVISGVDSICNYDTAIAILTVTLSGNNPPWSFIYTINGENETEVTGIEAEDAIYELEVSDTGLYELVEVSDTEFDFGTVTGSGHVAYYPMPTATLTEEEFAICGNDEDTYSIPVELTGKAPWSISYEIDGEPGGIINGIEESPAEIDVSIEDAGLYTIAEVIDANCIAEGTGSTDVIEKENPQASMSGDVSVCPEDTAVIEITLSGDGPWTFYYTRDGSDEDSVIVPDGLVPVTYELEITEPGLYELTGVKDQLDDGCFFGQSNVEYYDLPTASITGDESICEGTSATFPVTLTGEGPWDIIYRFNGIPEDTIEGIGSSPYLLEVSKEGNYSIAAVNDMNCTGTASGSAHLDTILAPNVVISGEGINISEPVSTATYSTEIDEVPLYVNFPGGNFNESDYSLAIQGGYDDWTFYPLIAYIVHGSPFMMRYAYQDPGTGCVGKDSVLATILESGAEIQFPYGDSLKPMYCCNEDSIEIIGVNIEKNIGSFSITGNSAALYQEEGSNTAFILPWEIGSGRNVTVTYSVEVVGEIITDQETFSFNLVNSEFTWDNECYNDSSRVQFTDLSYSESFYDDTINTYIWNFEIGEEIVTRVDSQTTMTFENLDSYNVEHIVISNFGCSDTTVKPLILKPTYDVFQSDYYADFSSGTSYWESKPVQEGSIKSWELGSPSEPGYYFDNTRISNAWYTDIVNINLDEESFVISPCYDFTRAKRPMIKMDIWRGCTDGYDGAVLQYTNDNGENWYVVGRLNDGSINWYNTDDLDQPGIQIRGLGWTGHYTNWETARHTLDGIIGSPQVRFRIAYGAEGISIPKDGFAFDNVRIGERSKRVLVEYFTNSGDEDLVAPNASFNRVINNQLTMDAVDLQYHMGYPGNDPFYALNPYIADSREAFYGLISVPYAIMDGGPDSKPGYKFDYSNDSIEQIDITRAVLGDNKFDIDITTLFGTNSLSIEVEVSALTAVEQSVLTLHVVIIEELVKEVIGENGEDRFENVVKKMLPNPGGTTFNRSWSIGNSESVYFDWDYEDVFDEDELRVVAFIQNNETREVYQVGYKNPYIVDGIWDNEITEGMLFTLYPNPAMDYTILIFNEPLKNETRIELLDFSGRSLESSVLYANQDMVRIDLNNLEAGIYIIRTIDKNNRVSSQKLVVLRND